MKRIATLIVLFLTVIGLSGQTRFPRIAQTLDELRNQNPSSIHTNVLLSARAFDGDMGGGLFEVVPDDLTETNRGTVFLSLANPNFLLKRVLPDKRINVCWFGASPAATATANTIAIQDAAHYASNLNATLYIPEGTYSSRTGLWFCCNVDATKATLSFANGASDNGWALTVGSSNIIQQRIGYKMHLPELVFLGTVSPVTNLGAGVLVGIPAQTNLIGVRVLGLFDSEVFIPKVYDAGTAVQLASISGLGYVHGNTFTLGRLLGFGVKVHVTRSCNENKFTGGKTEGYQFQWADGSYWRQTNDIGILLEHANGNTFDSVNLEGEGHEWMIYATNSNYNTFFKCRFEATSGGSILTNQRAAFYTDSGNYVAGMGNQIIGGFYAGHLNVSNNGVAGVQMFTSPSGLEIIDGFGQTPLVKLHNIWGAGHPALEVYDTTVYGITNNQRKYSTNWAYQLTALGEQFRFRRETNPWVDISSQNKIIFMGDGTNNIYTNTPLELSWDDIKLRAYGQAYPWLELSSINSQLRFGTGTNTDYYFLENNHTNGLRLGSNLRNYDRLLVGGLGISGQGVSDIIPSVNQAIRAVVHSTNTWEVSLQNIGASTNAYANSQFRVIDYDGIGSGVLGYFSSNTIWGSSFADKVVLYADDFVSKGLRLHAFDSKPIELASGTIGTVFAVSDNSAYFYSAMGEVMVVRSNKVFLPQFSTNTLLTVGNETNIATMTWDTNQFTNSAGMLSLNPLSATNINYSTTHFTNNAGQFQLNTNFSLLYLNAFNTDQMTNSAGTLALKVLSVTNLNYSTNHFTNTSGQLTLRTVWKDTMVPAMSWIAGGTAPVTLTNLNTGVIYVPGWEESGDTIGSGSIQLNHDCLTNVITLRPHVHYAPIIASGAGSNIVWRLDWSFANIGQVFGAAASIQITNTVPTNAWQHALAGFGDLTVTNTGVSPMFNFALVRVGGSASDTYADDAAMFGFDLHYPADSMGSNQETVK